MREVIETAEAARLRTLTKGERAVGTVTDTWGLGRNHNRAPNGDYLWGIEMALVREGKRRRTSKRIHQIPKNRTHLVDEGAELPVRIDPKDPKRVEIDWENYQRIDTQKALDRIVAKMGAILRTAGYRKCASRTFNCRKGDGLIHVVDFQASRWGDGFTVNVAVYLRELRRGHAAPLDERRVQESDCTPKLRWRIGQLMPGRGDRWWSYRTPDATGVEIAAGLTRYVLPHLKRYESRALIQAGWKRAKRK